MERETHLVVAPKQDVKIADPTHVPGVQQGNAPSRLALRTLGIELHPNFGFATPRRSTGVCPNDRCPIHPDSPVLTPA